MKWASFMCCGKLSHSFLSLDQPLEFYPLCFPCRERSPGVPSVCGVWCVSCPRDALFLCNIATFLTHDCAFALTKSLQLHVWKYFSDGGSVGTPRSSPFSRTPFIFHPSQRFYMMYLALQAKPGLPVILGFWAQIPQQPPHVSLQHHQVA